MANPRHSRNGQGALARAALQTTVEASEVAATCHAEATERLEHQLEQRASSEAALRAELEAVQDGPRLRGGSQPIITHETECGKVFNCSFFDDEDGK